MVYRFAFEGLVEYTTLTDRSLAHNFGCSLFAPLISVNSKQPQLVKCSAPDVCVTIALMEKETISREANDKDAWICVCGNTPCSDGFYPCNEKGVEVEPDARWTTNCYVCAKCGRIINFETLEVAGRNREIADGYAVSLK